MNTRKTKENFWGVVLLLALGLTAVLSLNWFLASHSKSQTFTVTDASRDTSFVFDKEFSSIDGRLVVDGTLDQDAELSFRLYHKNKPAPLPYSLELKKGEVSESIRFDMFDEDQIRLQYKHSNVRHGQLSLKLFVLANLFSRKTYKM